MTFRNTKGFQSFGMFVGDVPHPTTELQYDFVVGDGGVFGEFASELGRI